MVGTSAYCENSDFCVGHHQRSRRSFDIYADKHHESYATLAGVSVENVLFCIDDLTKTFGPDYIVYLRGCSPDKDC